MAPKKKANSLSLKRDLTSVSGGKDELQYSTNQDDLENDHKRRNVAKVADPMDDDGESDPLEEQLFSGNSSNIYNSESSTSTSTSTSLTSSILTPTLSSFSTPSSRCSVSYSSSHSSSSSIVDDDVPKYLHIAGPVEMKDLIYGMI